MGEILSQLAQLFIQTIPTVIFVFVLYVILSRFFFGPLTAVLKKREEETTGAMARAREQAAAAEEKARQYEAAFQAARQEIYRQREADRRAILEDREATLKRAQPAVGSIARRSAGQPGGGGSSEQEGIREHLPVSRPGDSRDDPGRRREGWRRKDSALRVSLRRALARWLFAACLLGLAGSPGSARTFTLDAQPCLRPRGRG